MKTRNLVRITLTDGRPTHKEREVSLSQLQSTILQSKGEGGSVLIHKEHLRYIKKENSS